MIKEQIQKLRFWNKSDKLKELDRKVAEIEVRQNIINNNVQWCYNQIEGLKANTPKPRLNKDVRIKSRH